MKAALLREWEKLNVIETEKPVPKLGQALLKVKYAGVCGSDITVYKGKHPTATAPIIVGHEILGTIEELNNEQKGNCGLKKGDRVAVYPLISCGICDACERGLKHVCKSLKLLGIHENGGYAEYVTADIKSLVKVSEKVSDKTAVLAEPFAVGFHVVKRSGLQIGDSVMVIGAGPIGIIIAFAARAAGASKILISEVNNKRISQAAKYGFDVVNPSEADINEKIKSYTGGRGFDKVFEVSGSKAGVLLTVDACTIGGTIVPLSLSGEAVPFILGKVSFKELKVVGSRVYTYSDFIGGVRLLEKLNDEYDLKDLISDEYELSDSQKAIDSMINGTNQGKIIIKLY